TVFPPKAELVWKVVNHQFAGLTVTNRDLTLCNLDEANLAGTKFVFTDLRGSSLRHANLRGADLQTASLNFIDWRDSLIDTFTRMATKPRLIWQLSNEDSSGRDLTNLDLSNSSLIDARLSGATLAGVNLSGALLITVKFTGAN